MKFQCACKFCQWFIDSDSKLIESPWLSIHWVSNDPFMRYQFIDLVLFRSSSYVYLFFISLSLQYAILFLRCLLSITLWFRPRTTASRIVTCQLDWFVGFSNCLESLFIFGPQLFHLADRPQETTIDHHSHSATAEILRRLPEQQRQYYIT